MRLGIHSLSLPGGALLLTCSGTCINGGEAFIAHPSPVLPPPFSGTSAHHPSQNELHQRLSCAAAVADLWAPPSCGSEPQHRHSSSVGAFASRACRHPRRRAEKRGSTALWSGSSGQGSGPGTQQLSREAKLAISILIDVVGMSSYALPALGEVSDAGWAPISSALIFYLYGNNIFAGLAFVEEILPGFDIIPTATIAWFLTNSEVGQNVTNATSGKTEDPSKKPSWGSSGPPPPPPPSSAPFTKGDAGGKEKGSRTVDSSLVQSGVIDVEAD